MGKAKKKIQVRAENKELGKNNFKNKNKIKFAPHNECGFDGYRKIGEIPASAVNHRKGIYKGDIRVNANHIKHIKLWHSPEMDKLNFTPLKYVIMVANYFTEIRKATGSSLLLVMYGSRDNADTITIELMYNEKHFYEVKTAQPRRSLVSNELLWVKGK